MRRSLIQIGARSCRMQNVEFPRLSFRGTRRVEAPAKTCRSVGVSSSPAINLNNKWVPTASKKSPPQRGDVAEGLKDEFTTMPLFMRLYARPERKNAWSRVWLSRIYRETCDMPQWYHPNFPFLWFDLPWYTFSGPWGTPDLNILFWLNFKAVLVCWSITLFLDLEPKCVKSFRACWYIVIKGGNKTIF